MHLAIVAAMAAVVINVIVPETAYRKYRSVTMTGCVQATGDPSLFLLTVPGDFPDAVRGIAKGDVVPRDSGVGSAPRPNPQTVPPPGRRVDPGLPEGRNATPTIQNHSYKLLNVKPARLTPMVGKAIEVSGQIPVEGYPSGDEPQTGASARALTSVLNPPFRVRHLKLVADSCVALIRSK